MCLRHLLPPKRQRNGTPRKKHNCSLYLCISQLHIIPYSSHPNIKDTNACIVVLLFRTVHLCVSSNMSCVVHNRNQVCMIRFEPILRHIMRYSRRAKKSVYPPSKASASTWTTHAWKSHKLAPTCGMRDALEASLYLHTNLPQSWQRGHRGRFRQFPSSTCL